MKEIYKSILEEVNAIFPKIIEHRRKIHKWPELSFREYKTSRYIKQQLGKLGISYTEMCMNPAIVSEGDDFEENTKTGVVALIGRESSNCVALRADIDALAVYEETGLEFSSKNRGKMHACGHDLHIAMLLGAAEILKNRESKLDGCIKLIFQPGEEFLPGGASIMIEEGVLESPKPKAIFAQHINPGEKSGMISFVTGPSMASTDELYWTIRGKSSHAAQPHLGNDPILAAASLVQFIQTMTNKLRNPLSPGLISITSIHGGTTTNIFPEVVELKGTMRTFDPVWRDLVKNELNERCQQICGLYNTSCELKIVKGYPPLINNEQTTAMVQSVAESMLGKNNTSLFEPKMWAEDFAYFAERVPATFWYLGVRPEGVEEMPPLHNQNLSPDEKAMINGTAMSVAVAIKGLKS